MAHEPTRSARSLARKDGSNLVPSRHLREVFFIYIYVYVVFLFLYFFSLLSSALVSFPPLLVYPFLIHAAAAFSRSSSWHFLSPPRRRAASGIGTIPRWIPRSRSPTSTVANLYPRHREQRSFRFEAHNGSYLTSSSPSGVAHLPQWRMSPSIQRNAGVREWNFLSYYFTFSRVSMKNPHVVLRCRFLIHREKTTIDWRWSQNAREPSFEHYCVWLRQSPDDFWNVF